MFQCILWSVCQPSVAPRRSQYMCTLSPTHPSSTIRGSSRGQQWAGAHTHAWKVCLEMPAWDSSSKKLKSITAYTYMKTKSFLVARIECRQYIFLFFLTLDKPFATASQNEPPWLPVHVFRAPLMTVQIWVFCYVSSAKNICICKTRGYTSMGIFQWLMMINPNRQASNDRLVALGG